MGFSALSAGNSTGRRDLLVCAPDNFRTAEGPRRRLYTRLTKEEAGKRGNGGRVGKLAMRLATQHHQRSATAPKGAKESQAITTGFHFGHRFVKGNVLNRNHAYCRRRSRRKRNTKSYIAPPGFALAPLCGCRPLPQTIPSLCLRIPVPKEE